MLTCSPLPITQPLPGSLADVVSRLERTDASKLHLIPKHSHWLFGQSPVPESQSMHGLNAASQGPDPMYVTPQPQIPSQPGLGIFDNRRDQRQSSGNTGLPAADRKYRKKINREAETNVGTSNSYRTPGWAGTPNELMGPCPQLQPGPPIRAAVQAGKLFLLLNCHVPNLIFF